MGLDLAGGVPAGKPRSSGVCTEREAMLLLLWIRLYRIRGLWKESSVFIQYKLITDYSSSRAADL